MEKFTLKVDISKINDSMELDSEIEIARIENEKYAVTIEVRGSVRVVYKDDVYKCSSQMPDELIQLFHDGKADDEHGVYVDMNNWFECFFWKKDGNKLVWTDWSDSIDLEASSPEELQSIMHDWLMEYIEDYRIAERDVEYEV